MSESVISSSRSARSGAIVIISLILFGIVGCTSYRIGKPADTPFRTIYIEPVANRSFAPQAQALLSTQVREHFMRDGRVRVVDNGRADAILSITLVDYGRDASAVRGDDTAIASKFSMSLAAECTLVDTRTGHIYFRNRATDSQVDAFFGVDEDLPLQGLQSEFQTMPILTEKLSRQIGNMVLHTW